MLFASAALFSFVCSGPSFGQDAELSAQVEKQYDAYDAAFSKSDVETMAGFLRDGVVWYAFDGTKHEGSENIFAR